MPNWCSNVVSISGPLEDVTKAVQAISVAGGEPDVRWLRFSVFDPRPEGLDGGEACNWSSAHWGTKWDLGDDDGDIHTSYDDGDEHAVASSAFQTAWGPPLQIFEKLSDSNPGVEIEIEYDEPGMDFWGRAVLRGGKVLVDEEGPSKQNLEWASESGDEDSHWVGDECDAPHYMARVSGHSTKEHAFIYLACGTVFTRSDETCTCTLLAAHDGPHSTQCLVCKGYRDDGTCPCTHENDDDI